jgi:hypothetical protein
LKRFYDVATELPTHYDLVVNTDGFSVEEAAALVAQVAAPGGGRSGRQSRPDASSGASVTRRCDTTSTERR